MGEFERLMRAFAASALTVRSWGETALLYVIKPKDDFGGYPSPVFGSHDHIMQPTLTDLNDTPALTLHKVAELETEGGKLVLSVTLKDFTTSEDEANKYRQEL